MSALSCMYLVAPLLLVMYTSRIHCITQRTCTHTHTCTHMYTHEHTCTHTHAHTCTHTHTYTHTHLLQRVWYPVQHESFIFHVGVEVRCECRVSKWIWLEKAQSNKQINNKDINKQTHSITTTRKWLTNCKRLKSPTYRYANQSEDVSQGIHSTIPGQASSGSWLTQHQRQLRRASPEVHACMHVHVFGGAITNTHT